jgi:dsDNA-specific endonuclease/ATPase MutS2
MISVSFDEKVKIGLQYVLEGLHGCCPFGQERIRHLRFYAPDQRTALETELGNVERCAARAGELKEVYDKIMILLCQVKDIRTSLRRCAEGEVPDHVELFEIKGYLQRLESLIPLLGQMDEVVHLEGVAFHDPAPALAILDPENTRSRGFYIPDGATAKLREIRQAKKQIEEQLYHARTDAEKDDLRMKRTRICAEEESEEMKVRRAMGAALAPMVDNLLADADTAGRLDFLIQKALFAVRYGGVRPELTETALELEDMVNPELVDLLEEKGRRFVPVSIALDRGATVITGANMGGKSVAMKTVALNALLLHAGFLVCAKRAKMPLFHSVRMLFDDLQSIQSGLSGFGSEIVEFQKALDEVEQGYSLFLLDEFARGTNPDEGAVIVQAVTRYLNDVNAVSVLTTHYDKVAEHARIHYQIIGLRDVDPERIRAELAATSEDGVAVIARHMNYGLYRVEGKADCPRDALNICRMLSLKPEILERIEQSY